MCAAVFAETKDLKTRLAVTMHSKLDLVKNDRKLLGVSLPDGALGITLKLLKLANSAC